MLDENLYFNHALPRSEFNIQIEFEKHVIFLNINKLEIQKKEMGKN